LPQNKACESFEVLAGCRPPTAVGRLGRRVSAYIRLGRTVWLDSGIPRENLDPRLEDRPFLNPVHIMHLILLGLGYNRLGGQRIDRCLAEDMEGSNLRSLFSNLLESTTLCRRHHNYLPLW
jgi:hypothetical protein